jgi:hypothetical protein
MSVAYPSAIADPFPRYIPGFESAAGSGSSLYLEAQVDMSRDIDGDRDTTWI